MSTALGIDLGSSGLRAALLNADGQQVWSGALPYPGPFDQSDSWLTGTRALLAAMPIALRRSIAAVAVDGTSGTLLLCDRNGRPLGDALPYHHRSPEQETRLRQLVAEDEGPAGSTSGSLARALALLDGSGATPAGPAPLLRHQADWLMGWLLGCWRWGEEGNNLRLGWRIAEGSWLEALTSRPWAEALPEVVSSGTILGTVGVQARADLGLEPGCLVVAGTTDANAAVLAADLREGDGITVLGTTIALKCRVEKPVQGAGITMHRLGGHWLAGGASNAGCGVLDRELPGLDLTELSRQLDWRRPTGLDLLPLPGRGERFPDDDPHLEPRLNPRPVSDALYLQALLEGLTRIEARGWQRLKALGAPPLRRVITLGGGARNPQWRAMRQHHLGVPVLSRPDLLPAAGVARLALAALTGQSSVPLFSSSR
ncbi:sugar kinase [Synechococcus sp. RSCCF101]|uniref:FGGY-family carbohydrate kinase n=1 Tax=Synechococcus sp. RSCCF101 TaxID=2511069 RepID=UPI001247F330|nr:FGGY-family carbohydrate kinase [Synechococcus sp. RSCCF101]QEY32123.1 sugar kinase [Synechococcus sp. RSCCF101]